MKKLYNMEWLDLSRYQVKGFPMNYSFSKRGLIILVVLLTGAFLATYFVARPRLVPGQKPIMDISIQSRCWATPPDYSCISYLR